MPVLVDRSFDEAIIAEALLRAKAKAEGKLGLKVPDFWTSQSHSRIRTQYGEVPFVPFEWQKQFIDGISRKEMVLKSRDVGSSEICVRFFCWMQLRDGGNILIKADKHDDAKNLIKIAKQYLTSLPKGERPTLTKENETELELEGIGTIKAMAQGGGRSERCKYLLMTERAFWEKPQEELEAISGALVADGWEIVESTANGFNEYHELWTANNGYRKTFVGRWDNPTHDARWWVDKRSQMNVPETQEELPASLLQEYPESAHEAFVASGNCVFDVKAIQNYQKECRKPLETRLNGAIKIWERPVVGRRYVVGADVAEGMDAGNDRLDYSGAAIYDWQTCKHVADLHGQFPLDVFAAYLHKLASEYNSAFLGVERNNHGHAVLLVLQQLEYPSLYWHTDPASDLKQGAKPKRQLGWPTNRVTKPIMEQGLGSLIAAGGICSYDEAFWDECLSYVQHGNGQSGAQTGAHDDRVIKHMIALQMRNHLPMSRGLVVGQIRVRG